MDASHSHSWKTLASLSIKRPASGRNKANKLSPSTSKSNGATNAAIEIVATSYPIKTMILPGPCLKRFRVPLHSVLRTTSFLLGPDSEPIPGSKKWKDSPENITKWKKNMAPNLGQLAAWACYIQTQLASRGASHPCSSPWPCTIACHSGRCMRGNMSHTSQESRTALQIGSSVLEISSKQNLWHYSNLESWPFMRWHGLTISPKKCKIESPILDK